MAERKVKIVAIIDAESGDYDKTLTSVQGKTTLFGNVVQGIFQGIGQAIYRHFVGGLTDAGKKMIGMIGDSIGKAGDLEYALAEVATLGVEDMEKMRRGVLDLSYAIGEDAVKGTKALYQAISAGVPEENVLTFIETASKGAIAGLTGTEVVVDALTSVINAYSLAWGEAARVSDLLFTTVKYGKTEMSLLAPVIGRVAPLASAVGVSLEEMFTWIAKITQKGIQTSEAITGLSGVLRVFTVRTKESAEVLDELGYTWETATDKIKEVGLAELLSEMNKDQLYKFIGRSEALVAALATLGDDPGLKKFTALLEEFRNSAGATGTAFGEMTDSFNFQLKLLKIRIATAKTEVGAPLMEIGKEIVKSINEWLDMPGPDGRTPIQAFSQWADRVRKRVIDDLDLVRKGEKTWGEIIDAWIRDSAPEVQRITKEFVNTILWPALETALEALRPHLKKLMYDLGRAAFQAFVDAIPSLSPQQIARKIIMGRYAGQEGVLDPAVAAIYKEYQESIFGPTPPTPTKPPARIELPPGIGTRESPWDRAKEVAAGLKEAVEAAENYIKVGGKIHTLKSMGLDDAAKAADELAKELDDLGEVQEGYYRIVVGGVETVGKLDEAISGIDTKSLQNSIEETLAETTETVKDYTGSVFWADFKASLTSGWETQSSGILAFAENVGKDIVQMIASGASARQAILTGAIAAIVESALGTASAISHRMTSSRKDIVEEGEGYIYPQQSPEAYETGPWAGWKASLQQAITINIPGAGDPDLVAEKVAHKILDLQRFGRFSLAPGLAK